MAKIKLTKTGFEVIFDKETVKKNLEKYAAMFKAVASKKCMTCKKDHEVHQSMYDCHGCRTKHY